MALEVASLSKRYGQTLAVDDLSFSVEPGEIMALLGPNGAGKTTTLLCLAGLIRPDAGRVAWQGAELGAGRGRLVALIPETPDVYEMLTVWEHMVFVARSCRLAAGWETTAHALLERLQLTGQEHTLGEALSKGMRQKLLIAASVLAGTPVLLLDEPMIGLDPAGQRELKRLLLDLRDAGSLIIISTHLLENVESFGDRLLILKEGRLAASGGMAELLAQHGGRSLEEAFFDIVR